MSKGEHWKVQDPQNDCQKSIQHNVEWRASQEEVDKFQHWELSSLTSKVRLQTGQQASQSTCYLRLTKEHLETSRTTRHTKLRLFKTLVKTVSMYGSSDWYGSETWMMTKGDQTKLDVFQTKFLRRILKIRWQEDIKSTLVTSLYWIQRELKNMSDEARRTRWKYIG